MSTDFTYVDATDLAELIRTGKASSVEVVQAHLDRIEAVWRRPTSRSSRTGSSPTTS